MAQRKGVHSEGFRSDFSFENNDNESNDCNSSLYLS